MRRSPWRYAPNLRVFIRVTWREVDAEPRANGSTWKTGTIYESNDASYEGLCRAQTAKPNRRIHVEVYDLGTGAFLIGSDDATPRTLLLLSNHIRQLSSGGYQRVANNLAQIFCPAPHLDPDAYARASASVDGVNY